MNLNELDDTEDTEHTPQERAAAASRSTWVSVVVNLVLSTVQIVAGVWAKSQSLIADGIHSLSDLVADFVVLFANHHSQKDTPMDTSGLKPPHLWCWACCCSPWAWAWSGLRW